MAGQLYAGEACTSGCRGLRPKRASGDRGTARRAIQAGPLPCDGALVESMEGWDSLSGSEVEPPDHTAGLPTLPRSCPCGTLAPQLTTPIRRGHNPCGTP